MSRGRPLAPVDGKYPNRLRDVRQRLGLTHEQIGKILGVSAVQAGRLERGTSRLSDAQIAVLSKQLDVEQYEFFADQPNDRQKQMMAIFRKLSGGEQDQLIKIGRALAEPVRPYVIAATSRRRAR